MTILAALLACTSDPVALPHGIVLISIDTLRADHLGLYGYGRDTSPFLDELGARSAVFDWAIAPYPTTLASHTSMLTGLHPMQHRVIDPGVALSPEIPTVAERLSQGGWATAAMSEVSLLRPTMRGFDSYQELGKPGAKPPSITETLPTALAHLRAQTKPFFLLVHTYAPHTPYDPPPPYREVLTITTSVS